MEIGDYDGRTALHLAAAEGHARCVRFLLEVCGVPHDCKDRWGQTPLSEAIQFKHIQVAAILRRYERSKEKGKTKSATVIKYSFLEYKSVRMNQKSFLYVGSF